MNNMKNEQKKEAIKKAIRRIEMGKKAWSPAPIKKAFKQSLPIIKILATREVKMVEVDVDIPTDAKKELLKMARIGILKDEKALLNWAFAKGIEYGIQYCKKKKNE
jgi:hypothetical protein